MRHFGKRGSIWVFLKKSVSIVLYADSSPFFFHALVHFDPDHPEVLVTGMHAPSSTAEKTNFWNSLSDNHPPPDTPWLALGDMNVVTSQSEKMGGRPFNPSQSKAFGRWMDTGDLIDLNAQGPAFTWTNDRHGIDLIKERLDRAVANPSWLEIYPSTQVQDQVFALPKPIKVWCPPPSGFFKLNSDGAWRRDGSRASCGGVVRDELGNWLLGFSWKIHACSPLAAELLAVKHGLMLCRDYDIDKVIVETDAKGLKSMLDDPSVAANHFLGNIDADITELLSRDWTVTFTWASRTVNKVAHQLAELALSMDEEKKIFMQPPDRIRLVYEMDQVGYKQGRFLYCLTVQFVCWTFSSVFSP